MTTASDIYSLGVLLFELLTGDRPFTAGLTRALLAEAIRTRNPRSPSETLRESAMAEATAAARSCTVRALAAQLAGDLDVITLKALRRLPGERYATADALFADIECFLEGEPIAARRSNRWYRTRKFIARHKASVIGASLHCSPSLRRPRSHATRAHAAAGHAGVAAAQRDRALALSSRNEAIADFLNVLITESASSDRPLTSGEMLARSEAVVSAEFRGNTEQRTAVLDLVGVYYRTMGDEKRAVRLLQEAFETIASSPEGSAPQGDL